MSAGHHHPSRAGEPVQPTARVRHRHSGREGRVIQSLTGAADEVCVLFDGATGATPVHSRNLEYLDGPGPSAARARP